MLLFNQGKKMIGGQDVIAKFSLGRVLFFFFPCEFYLTKWGHMRHVYQFPRAAITKYFKLGGLEQQKNIILCLRRLEVRNQGTERNPPLLRPVSKSFLCVTHLLLFWWLWRCSVCSCTILFYACVVRWHSPCISVFLQCLPHKKTLCDGPGLLYAIWSHITLTSYICNDSFHIWLQIWGAGGKSYSIIFWGVVLFNKGWTPGWKCLQPEKGLYAGLNRSLVSLERFSIWVDTYQGSQHSRGQSGHVNSLTSLA